MNWTLIIVALIAAVPPTFASYMSRRKTKADLEQIHILVNSRLTTALQEIQHLREYIDSAKPMKGGKRASESAVPPKSER